MEQFDERQSCDCHCLPSTGSVWLSSDTSKVTCEIGAMVREVCRGSGEQRGEESSKGRVERCSDELIWDGAVPDGSPDVSNLHQKRHLYWVESRKEGSTGSPEDPRGPTPSTPLQRSSLLSFLPSSHHTHHQCLVLLEGYSAKLEGERDRKWGCFGCFCEKEIPVARIHLSQRQTDLLQIGRAHV